MSNVTLALTGVSATGQVGTILAPATVIVALPTPRLIIAGPGAIPDVIVTLPTPILAITGAQGATADTALTLATPTLAVTGLTSVAAQVRIALPTPTLAITGETAAVGNVQLTWPVPSLAIGSPAGVVASLPAPSLVTQGATGVVGGVTLTAPSAQLAAGGEVPFTANTAVSLPVPAIAVSGAVGIYGAAAATLRGLALAVDGYTGQLGQVTLTLPVFDVSVAGYTPLIGQVSLVLPSLRLVASGERPNATTGQGAIAMHTEALSLTTYSNFPFNSFAAFNGLYLAAGDNGIFALTGSTDNGAIIQAAARTGLTDFGTSFLKRVDRAYVGYRTNGDLLVRVFTDEVNIRDYRLTGSGATGLHGNHLRIGKGLGARYWQFEVQNMNGADFNLDLIEIKPTKLPRRVGGSDA